MTLRTKEDRERYAEHAAPESIKAELDLARAARNRAAEYVSWLEVLLARRCQQVAAGEWPPAPAEPARPESCGECGEESVLFGLRAPRIMHRQSCSQWEG